MGKKQRFYVVWEGRQPGVYDDYDDAFEQVDGWPGAKFKGYDSAETATEAYRRGAPDATAKSLGSLLSGAAMAQGESNTAHRPQGRAKTARGTQGQAGLNAGAHIDWREHPEIDMNAWAVDASCQGNPGRMEYRGVELATGKEIFRIGPFEDATNNIGEYLAIVHAMALMEKRGETHPIYSDSVSGMAWVRRRKINTQLKATPRNGRVFELLARAQVWINGHRSLPRVMKWQTELWGEIPADFGRK